MDDVFAKMEVIFALKDFLFLHKEIIMSVFFV